MRERERERDSNSTSIKINSLTKESTATILNDEARRAYFHQNHEVTKLSYEQSAL